MSTNPDDKIVEKKITPRAEDYSQWYLDIIAAADLADYGPVKGTMVIKPYGYAIWEATQKILDEKFKETGVQNAYFPMLIPEKLLKKEEKHVEGFAPEVAVVTHAGGKKLDEPLVIRPTSETVIYDVFSNWIRSYRDLPLLINQWANVVRWELRTRLFLRTTEFLWQEGHTVHETEQEADERARNMIDIYQDFAENYMAIPVMIGTKTEAEKFAGALRTYCVEAMMQDGKALQYSTSHNLGQNFAKVFDVKFLDRNNTEQFGWQTSWGLSTRTIGGLIMVHSDDKGLVMPPKIASIQAIITTIVPSEKDAETVVSKAQEVNNMLKAAGIKSQADIRDLRPGEKYFEWEKKGVPIRIELGPKDIANDSAMLVRRDTGEKIKTPLNTLAETVMNLLGDIQKNLYDRALEYQKAKTKHVDTWDDFVKAIDEGNFVWAHWSGEADVEAKIKEETGATIRCIPFDALEEQGVCIKSGKPSTMRVVFAKAY
ncbi:proline--tRNA ligase [Candidatus Parcubacteria bacterium]|nr:proline--tRNA ligase [Candidatus Parcubacteria bacterium]